MAQHEEPMDIDRSVCDFDNKENAFQHSNVLPRTPCTEKGYEELDVSELNIKLRYSTTPILSPMSKSYTANSLDNRAFDSGNNVVDIEGNLTRSMNSAVTKNDSVVRQQMCLPLQTIPVEQGHVDTNRNTLRPFDSTVILDNKVVLTVSTPNEIDENLSLPSSSSSMVHTPEATTPNKEELKDGGSPIMRGLKSVINLFRPSQSPIPPTEDDTAPMKTEALSPPIVSSPEYSAEKSQAVLVSTPLTSQKTKEVSTKTNGPNRDSLVFNEDLEKELQWKDETTILFSTEKIPIHKLFFQTGKPFETKAGNTKTDAKNLNNTVEFMDISYSDSVNKTLEIQPENLPVNKSDIFAIESDNEFVDCESTFTKNDSQCDLSFKSQESLSETNDVLFLGGNVPICEVLNDTKGTLNVTTSKKSGDLSIVSTETTKGHITNKNTQKTDNVKETKEVSSVDIRDIERSAQVYSTQSALSVGLDVKQIVADVVSNVNIILDQNNTFNIEKDCLDSNAQVDSYTVNNIAIVANRNEDILNGSVGVSSLSQIPLISDPRVLLFNITSVDIPNTEIVSQEKPFAEGKLVDDLDTTPADIPLPDDDDIEKVSLEGVINNKFEETGLLSQSSISRQGEIIMPMTSESSLRLEDEEILHLEKTDCNKSELKILDMVQVSNEVANVIESAIIAVEQIVEDTKNVEFEPIDINEGLNACNYSGLNETNLILNAIENVANEIASIAEGEVTPTNTSEAEIDEHESCDIVEELQKTIEKLEGKGESCVTLNETRGESSIVTVNESKNATEVEEILKQNQGNFLPVVPDISSCGDLKSVHLVESDTNLANLPKFVTTAKSETNVETELKMHNIESTESTSLEGKKETADNVMHQELNSEYVVGESNVLVKNNDSIFQNEATLVSITVGTSIECNDSMEVDLAKEDNITKNEELITPTDETGGMLKQTPVLNVNILSSVEIASPLMNLAEGETKNVTICEEFKLNNEQRMPEIDQDYQNINEELVPEDKPVDSLCTDLKVDYKDAMDEEIVASANNSPFVSVSANFEGILEEKSVENFENIDIPVETNEEVRISPPSSPKIVSKGYNLNFEDIEDPFATNVKIRMSPPLDVMPNQSFDQTKDGVGRNLSPKKELNKERRKSQPLRKKPIKTNKKLNTTFSGSSKHTTVAEQLTAKKINPINENLQPAIDSIEVDGIVCESLNTPAEHKDLVVTNKALVNKVEDIVSIDVTPDKSTKSKNDCVTAKPVESEVHGENKPSTDTVSSEAEEIKNTSSSEQSAYYSAGTSSSENIELKSSYNIPEINDINFNPFASKSKVRQSPPPSLDNSFATKSKLKNSPDSSLLITKETNLDGSVNKSSTNQDSSNSMNNITCSSKNADGVNTEDEDTIEGPFLEAEDLGVENKLFESETQISINDNVSHQDDMMQFCELPITDEGMTDAGELFIDADAFEFLLNQNQNSAVADSGKESLFLKFDPLFAKRLSSDGVVAALKNVQKRQSTPKKTAPARSNAKMITESPTPTQSYLDVTNVLDPHDTDESNDDLNITVAKPMMVVSPAVNPVVTPRTKTGTPVASNRRSLTFTSPAIAVIDRLLSLSANNSAIARETTIVESSRDQNEADLALTQLRELLADKEINVYTLRSEAKELKDRLSIMESQVKSLETISEERLKNINELTEKLNEKTKHNKSMATVVEEYERMIASLIAEKEQDKKSHAEKRIQLIRERDEQTAHLASMEVSFSDLHTKYEKSKQIILGFKTNEEKYKNSIKEFDDNLRKMQNNYELLKEHATSKLNHANEELQKVTRAHEAEVLKLNAMIKRKELHITSLEETVLQKTKANEELTAICDELINKVSSR